ncbi:MAG: mevalonate kinase [Nitrososphaerota archaeon]|nr:mevalonate kinase [Nitrososphaerota archaeon]
MMDPMDRSVTWSAPGKVIICGEHFVVYGVTAIAAALDKRAYCTVSPRDDAAIRVASKQVGTAEWRNGKLVKESAKGVGNRLSAFHKMVSAILEGHDRRNGVNVIIDSQIPRALGLGSSASIAVAMAGALLDLLQVSFEPDDLAQQALIAESEIHYRPSGIDPAVTTLGGIIRFKRGSKPVRLEPPVPLELLVVETGKPKRTSEMVRKVAQFRELHVSVFDKLMELVEVISREVELAVLNNRLERLGSLLTINHNVLKIIGVSTRELDEVVEASVSSGAYGAKLTGGGGGGTVIAVASDQNAKKVFERLQRSYSVRKVRLPQEGVRRESRPLTF